MRALRKSVLLASGIVVALLLAECVLQSAAWVVRARGRRAETTWHFDRLRIVAVGDSNTYGLKLKSPESYPSQLQALWNGRKDLPPVEIVNLGVPGANSSKVRSSLPEILDTLAPQLVLVMIGANDSWTAEVPLAGSGETLHQSIWRHSRVYRAAYMAYRAFLNSAPTISADQVSVDVAGGPGTPQRGAVFVDGRKIDLLTTAAENQPDWPQTMAAHVTAMLDSIRSRGAVPVLLTYPAEYWMYGRANEVIREIAKATGVQLVDPGRTLARECPQSDCAEYFFLPDRHATARGNSIVARLAFETLASMLSESHQSWEEAAAPGR